MCMNEIIVFCSICKEIPVVIVLKRSLAHWHDSSASESTATLI